LADFTIPRVSPQEIKELIERAAKEPGINDVIALMKLSWETTEVEQIRAELYPQPRVMQVTGTGWVWRPTPSREAIALSD